MSRRVTADSRRAPQAAPGHPLGQPRFGANARQLEFDAPMTDNPIKLGPADPRRVDVHSRAEALWWAREFGVEVGELRDAVRRIGTDPRAVWMELVGGTARRPKATSLGK